MDKSNTIAIIGDIHGDTEAYLKLTEKFSHTVQVGDLNFNYSFLKKLKHPARSHHHHVFIAGNHDNHNILNSHNNSPPHYLGRYGTYILNGISFFFVSGAFSIDKKYRVPDVSWWSTEELSWMEQEDCLKLYQKVKPAIVISHSAPESVVNLTTDPDILRNFDFDPDTFKTSTQTFLQTLLDYHKPKSWFYGHFHRNNKIKIGETAFQCVDINDFALLYNI